MALKYENGNKLYEKNEKKSLDYMLSSAEHGLVFVQFILGNLYLEGKSVKKDYIKAEKYFTDAARHGYFPAHQELSYMYFVGTGVPKDRKQSAIFIKNATTSLENTLKATFSISIHDKIEHSGLSKSEIKEELEWLKLCSEMGYVSATIELGRRLITNYTNPYKMEEGRKYLEKVADQKYAVAYYYLGINYYGFYKKNYPKSIDYLKKSLALGLKDKKSVESDIQHFEQQLLGKNKQK